MINSVILVGRIVENPVSKVSEQGITYCQIVLAVTRAFKNVEGNYDCDFIRCVLWEALANSTAEYCQKGDVVGVRGRLAQKMREVTFDNNGEHSIKKIATVEVIAERVTFICTSRKAKEEIPEEEE